MDASECRVFALLSHSLHYHFVSIIKGILCLIGAIRITRQWMKYGVRFLVHKNTKTLFRYYFALNVLISTIFAFVHLAELIRLRFDCYLLDFRYILLTRGIGVCTIIAAQHVMLVLSLERLYSTIFPAHFERSSSKLLANGLAAVVIGGSYICGMMIVSDCFRLFHEKNEVALLSVSIPRTQVHFEGFMRIVGLLNLVSLLILLVDIYLNFIRPRKSIASLSVSYQLSENRRIVLLLLPIELTQISIMLVTLFAVLVHRKMVPNPTEMVRQLFMESVSFPAYLPLILTFIIKYSVEKRAYRAPPVDPAVTHFELLQRSWNA